MKLFDGNKVEAMKHIRRGLARAPMCICCLVATTAVQAETLNLRVTNSFNVPLVKITHTFGASEGTDIYESSYIPSPSPGVAFFAVQTFGNTNYSTASFPTNSYTTVTTRIEGNGLSTSEQAWLRPSFSPVPFNDQAFSNKNILGDLFSITNGSRSLILGSWNLKAMAATNGLVPLNITNGHSYDFDVRFTPLNNSPIAIDSSASGPKDAVLSGWFLVSDSDGVVTNVYPLSSPGSLVVNGTNWIYSPQGFKGTNAVLFYAVDNVGAASTTNSLTLITTNNPHLNQAVITNFTVGSGTATLDAVVSPGYEHVLLSSTNLSSFGPVATNVISYLGTNDMTPTSFSLPAASEASFYKLNSR